MSLLNNNKQIIKRDKWASVINIRCREPSTIKSCIDIPVFFLLINQLDFDVVVADQRQISRVGGVVASQTAAAVVVGAIFRIIGIVITRAEQRRVDIFVVCPDPIIVQLTVVTKSPQGVVYRQVDERSEPVDGRLVGQRDQSGVEHIGRFSDVPFLWRRPMQR